MTIEEFWIITLRSLITDVRIPINFKGKILKFAVQLLLFWLLFSNLADQFEFDNYRGF